MTDAAFVIPGDIDLPTGGYTYDRRVLALLPGRGIAVRHVALPGAYPAPSLADLAATARALAALPGDTALLIDGLAFGAMPDDLVAAIRQPIVALCHHPLALEAGLSPARQQELRRSETAALARAAHVVATSPMTQRILAADFGVPADSITVAEPGTDPAERATGSRAGSGCVHMLAVGSIVPRKGYDVLIRALELLPPALPWRLTIAGADDRSPETAASVRRAIAAAGLGNRIRMTGAVGQERLAALYRAGDLFVMSSLFEGYGMVLAEAMARGLAIVCTTGGAAADTAPDAAAIKVVPGDAEALAAAITRAAGDAELRRSLGNASWAAGQRLPRWSDTARIIAEVLGKVAR